MRRALGLACRVALLAQGATAGAGPAPADPGGWQEAIDSGSDRLALFALNRTRPEGSAAMIGALAAGRAVPFDGPAVIGTSLRAQPILRYDRNFNGGIPGREMVLGGLPFEVAEGDRARAGMVVGAAAQAGVRVATGLGSVATLDLRLAIQAQPAQSLQRRDAGLALCINQRLGGWTWFDGCASQDIAWRSWAVTLTQRRLSAGITTLGDWHGIDQQLSLSASRTWRDDYVQNGFSAGWLGAVQGIGAVSVAGDWASDVAPVHTRRRGLTLGLTRPVAGAMTRVGVDLSRSGGGRVFGVRRRDTGVELSLSRAIRPGLSLDLSLGRNDSNVDLYDETTGGIGFRLGAF